MRLPTRVIQLPQLLFSIGYRAFLWATTRHRRTHFRLCYFTCGSYFQYLYCSVHSIKLLNLPHDIQILVFCDREEPLSPEQTARLIELNLHLRVIPWDKAQGWGARQIDSIWRAYQLAASDAPNGAYLARVDSDVFFFSSWLFDVVAKTNADLVGDGHFVNFEYCQGGLYFFRCDAIEKVLAKTPLSTFESGLNAANIAVEDKAAHFLATKADLRIRLLFFMMFPDEYKNAGALTSNQRRKFACLHYSRRDKRPMVDIYLDQIIPPSEKSTFVSTFLT